MRLHSERANYNGKNAIKFSSKWKTNYFFLFQREPEATCCLEIFDKIHIQKILRHMCYGQEMCIRMIQMHFEYFSYAVDRNSTNIARLRSK